MFDMLQSCLVFDQKQVVGSLVDGILYTRGVMCRLEPFEYMCSPRSIRVPVGSVLD